MVERGYAVGFDSNYLVVRDIPYLDDKLERRIGAIVTKLVFMDQEHVVQEDHQIFFSGSHPHNTIDGSHSAIALSGANYTTVEFNKIENSTNGLMASGANFATVKSNLFGNFNTAMNFSGGSEHDIENNTASVGAIGLQLFGTTSSTLRQNTFLSDSLSGIVCRGASTNNTSANQDLGGEVCSGNNSCRWVISSQCRAS